MGGNMKVAMYYSLHSKLPHTNDLRVTARMYSWPKIKFVDMFGSVADDFISSNGYGVS